MGRLTARLGFALGRGVSGWHEFLEYEERLKDLRFIRDVEKAAGKRWPGMKRWVERVWKDVNKDLQSKNDKRVTLGLRKFDRLRASPRAVIAAADRARLKSR